MGFADRLKLRVYGLVLVAFGLLDVACVLVHMSCPYMTSVLSKWDLSQRWITGVCPGFFHSLDQILVTRTHTYAALLMGLVFILMGLGILRSLSDLSWKGTCIVVPNSLGQVKIAISALEEYIQKCGVGIRDVRDIRSKVNVRKKDVIVTSRLSIWAGDNVPSIADIVQETVKKNVQDLLGPDVHVKIVVSIDKIMPRAVQKSNDSVAENVHRPYP